MTESTERLSSALADRYQILSRLGEGGMATVYLAEDLKHKRQVAVKVLRPELAAVLGAERFVQEITTTANLQHPHILPLFDSGEADSFLYYVMPYIEGETLRSKLDRETQLGIDEAVKITTEVADALDYAHRQGVIHRDIKPENILLHDGRPMVADFGIALALSAAAGGRMTETGLSLGTPHYMSPEQATAEKDLTNRSDIYSLGAMLYEMLTGDPPHVGSSAQQIIMKIVTDEARPITELRKSVPPNVASAAAKALEKLPADRFEQVKDFAAALADPGFTTTVLTPADVGSRRLSWLAVLGILVLGVVLGGVGVWLSIDHSVAGESRREQLTFKGLARGPAITPDGDFVAYVEESCDHAQVGQCRSSLLVQEVGGTQPQVLISDAEWFETPRWSWDGQTLVVAGRLDAERAGLFAIPRLSGTPRLIGPSGIYDTHPAGDSVLVISTGSAGTDLAQIIDLSSGRAVDSFPVGFVANAVAWAPDGRHLAVSLRGGIQIVARDGHVNDTVVTQTRDPIRWSPDGTAVLYFRVGTVREDEFVRQPVGRDGTFSGPPEIVLRRVPTLYSGQFDVSRNTGQMALRTGDAITDIWSFDLSADPAAGKQQTRGTTWYGQPASSPDGSAVYYQRGDALGDNIYRLEVASGTEEALTAQALPGGFGVRISPDGSRLTYAHSSETGVFVGSMELPSRRISVFPTEVSRYLVNPLGPHGFLALQTSDVLAVLDSVGSTWRPLDMPDSLVVIDAAPSPDGTEAMIIAESNHSTGSVLAVGFVSIETGETHMVRLLEPDEPKPGLTWDRSGTYLGRWLPDEDHSSIWRLRRSDGRLVRVTTLPVFCRPRSISVGGQGTMASCSVEDFRGDIWLLDVPGIGQ